MQQLMAVQRWRPGPGLPRAELGSEPGPWAASAPGPGPPADTSLLAESCVALKVTSLRTNKLPGWALLPSLGADLSFSAAARNAFNCCSL